MRRIEAIRHNRKYYKPIFVIILMRNTEKIAHTQTIKTGKAINPKLFNLSCRGCKSKFNNFVKFCISPDYIKWDCDNCGNEVKMYCGTHETAEENTLKINVFQNRRGELTNKNFLLIDNSTFKEVLGELLQ